MSLQLIARCSGVAEVEAMLAPVCGDRAEVFVIDAHSVGISVPTSLLDAVGEDAVRAALTHVRIYDLYSGVWTDGA